MPNTGSLIRKIFNVFLPKLFGKSETSKPSYLTNVFDSRTIAKSTTQSLRNILNSTSRLIDDAHSLLDEVETDQFASNMKLVRKYFDYPAEDNSKILGSSNPLMPMSPIVMKAIVSSPYEKEDPYTKRPEKHQKEGNSWRYYRSRSAQGHYKLRDALFEYCEDQGFNNKKIDFVVTHSIPGSLLPSVCDGLLSRGDKILMTTPSFGPFYTLLHDYRFNLSTTRLNRDSDWKLTPAILERMLEENQDARMLIFINPGNPMGETYSREELENLSKIIINHNQNLPPKKQLFIFSDEVAKNCILNEDKNFTSIGSIPGMEDFTITAWSLSKDQGPGLGVAVGVMSRNIVEKVRKGEGPAYQSHCAAREVFKRENMKEMAKYYDDSVVIYRHHFKISHQCVAKINQSLSEEFGMKTPILSHESNIPDGGFQFVFSAEGLRGFQFPTNYTHIPNPGQKEVNNSLDLAWYLRSTCKVELVPGEGFGFEGEEMKFRMTISKREEILKDSFDRIKEGISLLRPSLEINSWIDESEIKMYFGDAPEEFVESLLPPSNQVKNPSVSAIQKNQNSLTKT